MNIEFYGKVEYIEECGKNIYADFYIFKKCNLNEAVTFLEKKGAFIIGHKVVYKAIYVFTEINDLSP
jgi:hypothetical protein